MTSVVPNLDEGPLPLGYIREEARKHLVDALDSRRGKKVLVLDPRVSGFLGLLAEVPLLREHGVEQLLHLGAEPLGDVPARNIIYLARSEIQNAQFIAQHIKTTTKQGGTPHEFAVFFMPRKTTLCEHIFQQEGVFGDIVVGEFPVDFIPFDSDVLSLELPTAFREVALDGDNSSLYYAARALTQLQARFGAFPVIKGMGTSAAVVADLLKRMRREAGSDAPSVGGSALSMLVLVDRAVDPATPLATQLTYEGTVDEMLGISNGVVSMESQGRKERMTLNSTDRTYKDLRDVSFAAVGPRLGTRAKALQSQYKDTKAPDRSLAELKEFAGQLKGLPQLQRHINLTDAVNQQLAKPGMRTRVAIEHSLLEGHGLEAACESIEELMYGEEPLLTVLRLLCLLSFTQGGVPKKWHDGLRRELLHTYGHEHLLTLASLQAAGLLRRQEGGRPAFAALRRSLRLSLPDTDNHEPDDVAYTFNGYAPISLRLVQAAVGGSGWGQINEEGLKALGALHFERRQQDAEEDGSAVPSTSAASAAAGDNTKRRKVVVMFLGG
ncbi:hypothetical protein WJX73_003066 [Symbiochloris irregularis]|uniref:Sec1-like protein n=1 Tax=Symbiochloris irregularis TaxID=706552 RepID=A0AAW1PG71_9CHLO